MRTTGAMVWVALAIGCAGPRGRATEGTGVAAAALRSPGAAVVSEEFALDHPRQVGLTGGCVRAAFGTTTYLATQVETYDPSTSWKELVAARFDAQGAALDPAGTVLAAFDDTTCSAVVFGGTDFLTLWASGGTLYCARIAEDGTRRDPNGVSTGLAAAPVVDAAFDGANLLVLSQNGSVHLVGTDCAGIGSSTAAPASAWYPTPGAIAFDGAQYWVAFATMAQGSPDTLYVQAVSTMGQPTGVPLPLVATSWSRGDMSVALPGTPGRVAASAGKAAVIYQTTNETGGATTSELTYRTLSPSGTLGAPLVVPGGLYANGSGLSSFDDGFLIAGPHAGGTDLVKISADATITSTSLADLNLLSPPAIARGAFGTLVAGLDTPADVGFGSSRVRLIDDDLSPASEPAFVATHAERHRGMSVVTSNDGSLAVFLSTGQIGQLEPDIVGSRVSGTFEILDSSPFVVHTANAAERLNGAPVVGTNGTDYLVLWGETTSGTGSTARVNGQRVAANGSLLGQNFPVHQGGGPNLTFYPDGYVPAVASNGTDYLVVWSHSEWTFPTGLSEVRAARVTSAGVVLDDPPIVLHSFTTDDFSALRLAEVFVVYDGTRYIAVSRVDEGGVERVSIRPVTNGGTAGPAVDSVVSGFLRGVAWGREQGLLLFAGGQGGYEARRLTPALTVLDATPIPITPTLTSALDSRASVAWDGTTYWVSWKDNPNPIQTDDVYAARVTTDGELLDPGGIVLSATEQDPRRDTRGDAGIAGGMLASGSGRVLAAYTRFVGTRGIHNYVMFGRSLASEGTIPGASGEGGESGQVGAGGSSGGGNSGGGSKPTGSAGGAGGEGGEIGSTAGRATGGGAGSSAGPAAGNGGKGGRGGSGSAGRGGAGSNAGGRSGGAAANSRADAGCGCRVTRSDATSSAPLLAAVLGLALVSRRRARREFPVRAVGLEGAF